MALDKPSDREDEYFIQLDREKLSKMRAGLDNKRQEDAKQMRKKEHWMKCPKCGSELQEVNYHDVMVDTCADCKGVWLDHGELELLAKGKAQMTKNFISKIFG